MDHEQALEFCEFLADETQTRVELLSCTCSMEDDGAVVWKLSVRVESDEQGDTMLRRSIVTENTTLDNVFEDWDTKTFGQTILSQVAENTLVCIDVLLTNTRFVLC